ADLKDGPSAGFGAVRELRAAHPGARVILLLNSADRNDVVEAFRSGALGVFSREEPFDSLCKSIKRVHQGQIWASNQQLRYLVETLTNTPAPMLRVQICSQSASRVSFSWSRKDARIGIFHASSGLANTPCETTSSGSSISWARPT